MFMFKMREKLHEIKQKNKQKKLPFIEESKYVQGTLLKKKQGGKGTTKIERKEKGGGTSMKGRGIPGPMPTIVCLQP